MRTITYLGLGLLVCGALVFVASSGAFDSTVADRNIGVETVDDDTAYVGISQPDVSLSASDGEFDCTGTSTVPFFWTEIEYCSAGQFIHNELILTLSDQTPSSEFEEAILSEISDSSDNPSTESATFETTNDEYMLQAEIQCAAECIGGSTVDNACQSPLGSWEAAQTAADNTATIELEVNGENISVDLRRTVEIECEGGTVTGPG
ncbi:hypothetical protein [Natronorubrum sp. DTA7]|uniref:hypothetical protein n=1 Tax=Natronorubrum sp. DTA7 TaxID=3447016 RepID=UPI003F86ED3A